jgi:hypothetical protein
MDLGPAIWIIEGVPALLPHERESTTPAPKEPGPVREPQAG